MATNSPRLKEIIELIQRHLDAHELPQAVDLIETHQGLLSKAPPKQRLTLLHNLPQRVRQTSPHLLALEAEALVEQGNLKEAVDIFDAARLLFLASNQKNDALRMALHLVRLHHLREDLGLARLYTRMVIELLRDPDIDDKTLEVDALLRVAILAPDIGLYAQGEELAKIALHVYERQGNAAGACDAALILFNFHNQTGRYQTSGSYLQRARQLQQIAGLGPSYQVAILNSDAHWHWYRGNLPEALELALQAIDLADRTEQPKQRIYNRLVAGNVARALGNFFTAQRWYDEAERLTHKIGFTLFLGWIDVHRAWLAILQEQYSAARSLLQRALLTHDYGQAMSFSVFQAVLYSLTGRFVEAVELLQRSLAFYQRTSDPLSVATLQLHLAFNFLQMKQQEKANQMLEAALGWMAEQRIDYLPHWWHPSIMATLCTHALAEGIYPHVAEQMAVKHLRGVIVRALQPLLGHADETVRRRAFDILENLNADPLSILGPIADETVRKTLGQLIASGRLAVAGLPALCQMLTTAERRNRPNPTLIAVFVLHVHGASRKQIADQLGISEAAVRNYITLVYKIFGLTYDPEYRRERLKMLRELARQAGFIPAEE